MGILALLGAVAVLLGILAIAHVLHLATGAIVALFIIGGVLILIDLRPVGRGRTRL